MAAIRTGARPIYTAATYDWHDSVGHRVAQLRCALRRNLEQELTDYGLSAPQWVILMKASHEPDLTAADLAKGLETDPGAMTRLLDRMEKKGLIRRVRAVDDRRRILIELSSRGRALAPVLQRAGIRVLNRALAGFTPAEFKQLQGLLGRMIDNVK